MKRALIGLISISIAFCLATWGYADGELGYWQLIYSNAMAGNSAFMKVSPADKDSLYVAGLHQHSALGATYGWKSEDGGYSWRSVYQVEMNPNDECSMMELMGFILDVKAFDADTALLVGFGVNEECLEEFPEMPLCMFMCMFDMIPKVLYTTDGGESWEQIMLGDPGELRFKLPNVVFFIDDQVGFMGGYGILYVTYDSGLTWAPVEIPETAKQQEGLGINGIFAFDHQHIFLATGDPDPDSGGKGADDEERFYNLLHKILFFHDPIYRLNAYLNGDAPRDDGKGINGALYYTSDGGQSWRILKLSLIHI